MQQPTLGIAITFPAPAVPSKHERLTREMAIDLLRFDAWRNDDDAEHCLMGIAREGRPKYRCFDVMTCRQEAQRLAMEEIIAKEMSDQ